MPRSRPPQSREGPPCLTPLFHPPPIVRGPLLSARPKTLPRSRNPRISSSQSRKPEDGIKYGGRVDDGETGEDERIMSRWHLVMNQSFTRERGDLSGPAEASPESGWFQTLCCWAWWYWLQKRGMSSPRFLSIKLCSPFHSHLSWVARTMAICFLSLSSSTNLTLFSFRTQPTGAEV